MKTKICSKCKVEKPLTTEYFYRDVHQTLGFSCRCKLCLEFYAKKYRDEHKKQAKEYKKKYYLENKSEMLAKQKEYSRNNKELIKLCQQQYAKKNKDKIKERRSKYYINNRKEIIQKSEKWAKNNKDKRKEYMDLYYIDNLNDKKEYDKKRRLDNLDFMRRQGRLYFQNNKRRINELRKKMRKNNPAFKIACNMRSRLWQLFKNGGGKKSDHTENLVGCSWLELRKRLESLFLDGMSWENYGRKRNEWSIDHIRPCASFDLSSIEEQRKCFHYSNLRPYWNEEQWIKNSSYKGKYIRKNKA